MVSVPSLIDELERTLSSGSSVQRADILRRVSDLFLMNVESYTEDHVAVFDDVMCHLIDTIERSALIRLSKQLAPSPSAPIRTVHRLAEDDDIEIARPLLERSKILSDEFLIELARTKSQAHLAAIAGRESLTERVTDVLVEHGDDEVTLKVTGNHGARFSRPGFMKVAEKAQSDGRLAELFVARADIPPDVFQHLLRKATEVVKNRLLKNADSEMRVRITRTLADIATEVARERAQLDKDTSYSPGTVLHLDAEKLKSKIGDLARAGKRTETIEALAALSKLPVPTVKNVMRQGATDGLLILCKSVALGWPDVKRVLATVGNIESEAETRKAFERYVALTAETANRVLRFVKSCKAISKADFQRML
ncbi:DUF2336 domain-containing protein [Rhodoplanes sp. TEM]|uniref:DUF2336 domain-containing protein n=1 Tax=Rhodoplanes tepidamans TaxID=200616 RepID=A0ABT5JDY2_RHOTP|nr:MULTISPECIES: DUF2336 domain-containing protein [Rhodoplanes]MDC7787814.1 DUF2336 domain-containing protein [Rhodoplanes tepidamans]MDC7987422.1 DUF2336 domain-containing protein [Rhodoplanes sp. TEM]MDQ0357730.1 uncharacterized protein (DUF2336 family) [Rhodoplanes tepidamans]